MSKPSPFKRLKNFVLCLRYQGLTLGNYKTDWEWDEWLVDAMKYPQFFTVSFDIEKETVDLLSIGNLEVWVLNKWYAYGNRRGEIESGLPSIQTMFALDKMIMNLDPKDNDFFRKQRSISIRFKELYPKKISDIINETPEEFL